MGSVLIKSPKIEKDYFFWNKKIELNPSFYIEHKKGLERSDFGLDNSNELIADGMGLYSTTDMKSKIGPIKTEFFRIA